LSYKIGIAGFLHESNSFLPNPTNYDAFLQTSLTRGAHMRDRWVGVSHELGGMFAGVDASGDTAVPLYATFAVPSATIERQTYDRITSELVSELKAALPLDALLLALHGATVAEDFPDADGELLSRVRAVTGPDLPIVITFDLHANLSPQMIANCTAAIGYRSNPHLDQKERGIEAAALLHRILAEGLKVYQHLESPPMLMQNSRQNTAQLPAKALYDSLAEVMAWPGIVTGSVAMGFPHSDVAEVGAHFVAVSDQSEHKAAEAAKFMARRAWDMRHQFVGALPSVSSAVERAAQAVKTPVVLMDVGDNVGGGSEADSTAIFTEILRQQVPNALIVLHAPAAVEACIQAGVRNTVRVNAGTPAIAIEGTVRTLHDGRFTETAVRHGGWTHNDQGITAVIETAQQHTIVLTSRRMAPFSLEQLISVGIRPERKRVLIVKGVIAPRAAYEPIAAEIILVDSPGSTADNPALLPYRNRRKPVFPLEPDAEY
jgi:microcystin degradation protein MlrC